MLGNMATEGRRFWLDSRYRHTLLGDVVAAVTYPGREDRLEAAVAMVDRAVEVGLAHFGIPRGPVKLPVRIEPRAVGRNAVKLEDCSLVLSSSYLRLLPRLYSSPDAAFRTWLHESIHARQPYDLSWRAEFEQWEGYEEGLADGMANVLCNWAQAFIPETTDYVAYVQAYQALAAVLQMSIWALLRKLWYVPTGQVRGALLTVVDEQYHKLTGIRLQPDAASRAQRTADALFITGRTEVDRSDREVQERWRGALE
jgi:hypothetical protein